MRFVAHDVLQYGLGHVPLFVIFTISLGNSFGFPINPHDIHLDAFKLALERIREEIDDFGAERSWRREAKKILRRIVKKKSRIRKFQKSNMLKFIEINYKKTITFLQKKIYIYVSQADKGGKSVIMHKDFYNSKMDEYMEASTTDHTYFKCNIMSLDQTQRFVENKYQSVMHAVNGFLNNDRIKGLKDLCIQLSYMPYIIPKIYGYIKIHKVSLPIRPIISSIDGIGKPLAKWLLVKLNVIANHLDSMATCNVKNSMSIFDTLNGHWTQKGQVLVVWDYESMYTNIPIAKAKSIIREYFFLIEPCTSVPVDIFLECISFFTEHSTYFLYKSHIYRQTKGLAMGNMLSQILAEIVVNKCIIEAKLSEKYINDEILYLGKYVDDILGVMQENIIVDLEKEILKNGGTLKLKGTMENGNNEVEYLNMIIRRCDDKIAIKWFQKEYYAGKILNYYSAHPLQMKQKVCEEYILSALRITDTKYWPDVIVKLRRILYASNYPNRFINSRFWNVSHHKYIRNIKSNGMDVYIGFPYDQDVFLRTKTMLKRLHLKKSIGLAPKIMAGIRRKIFSNLKCRTGLESIVNASATVTCNNCKFQCKISTSSQSLKRTVAWLKCNHNSQIGKHLIAYPNHALNENLKNVRRYENKKDLQLMLGCTI